MLLNCPSCGVKHDTASHPGAFEINCVCGYSILIPDEAALNAEALASESAPFQTGVSEESAQENIENNFAPPPPASSEAAQLTPSEELPEGMIYDPFEVQNMASAPTESMPFGDAPAVSEELSVATTSESSGDTTQSAKLSAQNISKPAAVETVTGQTIVNRTQAASMGQFLGASYKISCKNLTREALVELSKRCQTLLKGRPWLESELRRRNISLEALPDSPQLSPVPELIAVELYLGCFELGGYCESEKLS